MSFERPKGIPEDPPESPNPAYFDEELEKLIKEERTTWDELVQLNAEIKA